MLDSSRPDRPPSLVLPALDTLVIICAAVGMVIVVAPRELIRAIGLLPLRTAHDHVFGLVTLLLAAWASWIIAVRLAASHARRAFMEKIPLICDRLSAWQSEYVILCLKTPDLTVRCNARDSVARSLCELGLLAPPSDDSYERMVNDASFTMPADVAAVLRAHLSAGPAPDRIPRPAPVRPAYPASGMKPIGVQGHMVGRTARRGPTP